MDGARRWQIHKPLMDKQKERENYGERYIDGRGELKVPVKRQDARIQAVVELLQTF
jgi:hypothetical protein